MEGMPVVALIGSVAPDDRPKNFVLFGIVVLVVALAIMFIANMDTIAEQAAARRHGR